MNFEKVKPRSPRVFGTRELHGFTFLKFIEKWRIQFIFLEISTK
jgi:hypothetical protein